MSCAQRLEDTDQHLQDGADALWHGGRRALDPGDEGVDDLAADVVL